MTQSRPPPLEARRKPTRRAQRWVPILTLLCVVAAALYAVRNDAQPTDHRPRKFWRHEAEISVSASDPILGQVDAFVTLVAFVGFESVESRSLNEILRAVAEEYGPRQVRIVFKHAPHPAFLTALRCHEAAEVVFQLGGSRAFIAFQNLALENQGFYPHPAFTEEDFPRWAQLAGVKEGEFEQRFHAGDGQKKVKADLAQAQSLGLIRPRAVFINGIHAAPTVKRKELTDLIEAQLDAAKQLVDAGMARSDIYVELTHRNYRRQPPPPWSRTSSPTRTMTPPPRASATPEHPSQDGLQ